MMCKILTDLYCILIWFPNNQVFTHKKEKLFILTTDKQNTEIWRLNWHNDNKFRDKGGGVSFDEPSRAEKSDQVIVISLKCLKNTSGNNSQENFHTSPSDVIVILFDSFFLLSLYIGSQFPHLNRQNKYCSGCKVSGHGKNQFTLGWTTGEKKLTHEGEERPGLVSPFHEDDVHRYASGDNQAAHTWKTPWEYQQCKLGKEM